MQKIYSGIIYYNNKTVEGGILGKEKGRRKRKR